MHQKIGELLRVLYKKQSWHIAFYGTGWLSTNASDMNVCSSHQMQKYIYSSLHTHHDIYYFLQFTSLLTTFNLYS